MSDSAEPRVAQFNIGELLSTKRQQAHESIADVATKLKLSQSVIEKLEANQFSELGTSVYVRGYLGLYAKHLGFDGTSVIEQYNHQYPPEEVAIRPSAGRGIDEPRQKSQRHSKTLSLLMVAMVLGGLAFAYTQAEKYWQQKTAEESVVVDSGVETTDGNEVVSALNDAKAAQNLANDVLSGDTITTGSSLVTDVELDIALSDAAKQVEKVLVKEKQAEAMKQALAANDVLEGQAASSSNGLPKLDIQLESIGGDAAINKSNANAESSNAGQIEENATALSDGTARISFIFKEECWVKITDANKKVIAAKLYKAGDSLETSGASPLTVSTAAPSAIASVKFNDVGVNLADYKTRGIRYRLPKQ